MIEIVLLCRCSCRQLFERHHIRLTRRQSQMAHSTEANCTWSACTSLSKSAALGAEIRYRTRLPAHARLLAIAGWCSTSRYIRQTVEHTFQFHRFQSRGTSQYQRATFCFLWADEAHVSTGHSSASSSASRESHAIMLFICASSSSFFP